MNYGAARAHTQTHTPTCGKLVLIYAWIFLKSELHFFCVCNLKQCFENYLNRKFQLLSLFMCVYASFSSLWLFVNRPLFQWRWNACNFFVLNMIWSKKDVKEIEIEITERWIEIVRIPNFSTWTLLTCDSVGATIQNHNSPTKALNNLYKWQRFEFETYGFCYLFQREFFVCAEKTSNKE